MKHWSMLFLLSLPVPAWAAEVVDYEREIKPLLALKCAACHGALKQQAGLRLDAGELIRQGGESGSVVEPGDPDASELISRVATDDPDSRMPPEGAGEPLNSEQVLLLRKWIAAGAVVPQNEPVPTDPAEHWAYQIPRRPAIPTAVDSRWTHPIDAFIASHHRREGLQAVELAEPSTLLRRAYFDLVGLPPSRDQLRAFLGDTSLSAWRQLIDALLDSPHHGERWGRHWMDVWRYSDWDGYKQQLRGSQRHIWRWRDWIIDSLNADKGYDQMIVEMLAGDEVAPEDSAVLAATGFLARNYHNSNRNIWLDATVEHTAKAFLGLTINCARCHDHKYDPIPQQAYYEFRAVFEPHRVRTDRLPGQLDVLQDGLPRAYDAELEAETFVFAQGNDKFPDKDHPVKPATPDILGAALEVTPIELPAAAYFPAARDFVVRDHLDAARKKLSAAQLALVNVTDRQGDAAPSAWEIELLERQRAAAQLEVYAIRLRSDADRAKLSNDDSMLAKMRATEAALVERQLRVRRAEVAVAEQRLALQAVEAEKGADAQKRAATLSKARQALAEAEKKLKAARESLAEELDDNYTPLGKEYPRTSSGRRLALAKWITDPQNPLTARVAVNQIWMRHFGTPLVSNVFDFGLRSPRPQHADLLDWLAVELMENDWSMKHLHRLILTSRTWRLRSSADGRLSAENRSIDPDNHYLWKTNVRRLDAEIVRDNLLAVSGEMDSALGGADIDFREGEVSPRRSVYLRHAYEKQMTMLVLFDAASPNECYRRSQSVIPQQALALSNSSLSLGKSRRLAYRLWEEIAMEADPEAKFVRQAFLQLLSREPDGAEIDVCLRFLQDQADTLSDLSSLTRFAAGAEPKTKPASDPHVRARENLVHVLMNHNDFVTIR